MSEPDDPEHLLAQALRAQAARAPHRDHGQGPVEPAETERDQDESSAESTTETATVETPMARSYGLLSGAGASSVEAESAALAPAAPATPAGDPPPAAPGPAARWVLTLAVLLGLAAGAVVGLLTLV